VRVPAKQPEGLTRAEIHEHFRAGSSVSGDAINYPLTDAAYAWKLRFNGVPEGCDMPWTWRFASNAAMKRQMELAACE
jgi:hypothetical protein